MKKLIWLFTRFVNRYRNSCLVCKGHFSHTYMSGYRGYIGGETKSVGLRKVCLCGAFNKECK